MIAIDTLKTNERNPRRISAARLELLKTSITEFEKMLELRPIIVDETNTALGGNMRLAALRDLGYTELPDNWIKRADDLTDEQKRQFVIKDNIPFGDWDFELLADDWASLVEFDWFEEKNACCDCKPEPYEDGGRLFWYCDECGGGSAELIKV